MSQAPLRLLFAGTPPFAAIHLKHLIDSKHQLTGVYTQPDRPAGRGKKLQASAVKLVAQEAAIPVCQPATLKTPEAQAELAAFEADVLVVVAYGLILPAAVLDAPRLGCLNVHASLLPRWRGAAPIQRAIEAGDQESGITIMQMDEGLDTGDILAMQRCAITPQMSSATLHDSLAELGAPLLLSVLNDLENHQANRQAQPTEGATYAHKILKPEAAIDWTLSAATLDTKIRAFNPAPICFSTLAGERLRIWQAKPVTNAVEAKDSASGTLTPGTIVQADVGGLVIACGTGLLEIERLQLPGGKQLSAQDVLRAKQALFTVGQTFDAPAVSAS
ncbi:MAG: methionyl-tRNA formyltransferase [Halioglobus sp.]